MRALLTGLLMFTCVFGGSLVGILLQSSLPEHHRSTESKDTVKLVMSFVSTMVALVLSLLIVGAHGFYTTQQSEMQQLGVDILILDQSLARFGPETATAREVLRQDVKAIIKSLSPSEGAGVVSVTASAPNGHSDIFVEVESLMPKTMAQRFALTEATTLMFKIAATRLLIHEQVHSAIPFPLIIVLVCWLTLLFLGFGLYAPSNLTVIVALALGAVSVAGAGILMMEMSYPYGGVMAISSAPIRNSLSHIGQ
jgi:hypothetical protein